MKIKTITQTCGFCPSQWEGMLEDGRSFYIRYRWGYLSVRVSPEPTTDIHEAVGGEEVFGEQVGDDLDGFIELKEVLNRASLSIAFSQETGDPS